MEGFENIARILRADEREIRALDVRMSAVSGKSGVLDRLTQENESRMEAVLKQFELTREAPAREVYDALISKIEADDEHLHNLWGRPDMSRVEDAKRVAAHIRERVDIPNGFFLKEDKAVAMLHKTPPQEVMRYAGVSTVDELLKQEDLYEVYSVLRIIESREWMNEQFLPLYRELTPDDFEEREVSVRVLSARWNDAAVRFVHKKWHNISHLKELGVVFVIPVMLGISGELLRMTSLVLHYLNEIPFYADLFRKSAQIPELFTRDLISLLRGDVLDRRFGGRDKALWLVVQRYLAKDDPYDWRLTVPHVNPEARHWMHAEAALATLDSNELSFWKNLGWVGNYFHDETGNEILVSFDLVDTVMSLVMDRKLVKYLYHQQEALWNEIFIAHFGRDGIERFMREYLIQGYFEI